MLTSCDEISMDIKRKPNQNRIETNSNGNEFTYFKISF